MLNEPEFTVLDARKADEHRRWLRLWESWPGREVFAHPNYLRLCAGASESPLCACWESGGARVLYPYLLRPLQGEACHSPDLGECTDISSPYGYGGPFAWGDAAGREAAAAGFREAFGAWCRRHRVVSEFVRFSLFEQDLLPYEQRPVRRAPNVVRDLGPPLEEIWMDFRHKVRKNVRRAQSHGLTVSVDRDGERLDDFLRVYAGTMTRRQARQAYHFPREYFLRLQQGLPGQFRYFHVLEEANVVASELVLVSARSVYSFLGGTDSTAFRLRANDLLKYEIIRWAKHKGKEFFVLGGGYAADDGVYRYKLSFAPGGVRTFKTGQRIFDPERYRKLLENARRVSAAAPRAGYFPEYRA